MKASPGLAILCDGDGRLLRIISDKGGLLQGRDQGQLFPAFLDHESLAPALDFLVEIRESKAAFERVLSLAGPGAGLPLYFSGCMADGAITIVASPRGGDSLLDEIGGLNNDLINSQRALARKNAELATLSAEKTTLLHELRHRVKNSLSMILSMISLAATENSHPETARKLEELDARVSAVADLYCLLNSSDSFDEIALDEYFSRLASSIMGLRDRVSLGMSIEPLIVSAKLAAPLGLIMTELLTNSLKYAFPDGGPGLVEIGLSVAPTTAALDISDTGIGFPPDFDIQKSRGLGISLVRELSLQIGGSYTISRREGRTHCVLVFPREGSAAEAGSP